MKGTLWPITPSRILKLVLAIALAVGVLAPNLPRAHAQTTGSTEPRILVTYGKGAVTSGTWNEHILTVDGHWAYCVQVDKHFTAGLNVNAIDPVANGIWSQELCTRLALIDEVIWSGDFYSTSEAGRPSHRVTSNVEKYAIAQCYIWKALDDAGFSDYGWFAVAVDGNFLTGSDTDSQVREYVNAHKNDYVGHASYFDCDSSQNVACSFGTEPAKGRIQLQKSSADEAFVRGNGSYSLEGAVYGIYDSEACSGEPVSRMTTDATGHAESDAIARGDYFVREISASPGYEVDATTYPVTVLAGETVSVGDAQGRVYEQPQTGGLKVSKASALKSTTQGNALYTNEGAVFGIFADESCTEELARMTTGKQGVASAEGLPLGPKYVKEISAPAGMALDEQVHQAMVKANQVTEVGGGTVLDLPKTNAVKLVVAKHDSQKEGSLEANLPQGGASLENAEFTVRYFDGFYADAEEAQNAGTMLRSWVFKTDASGVVLLDSEHLVEGDALYVNSLGEPCLPLGTVLIEETKPPRGYLPNTQTYCAQITDDGSQDEFLATYEPVMAPDDVKRGDFEFVKVSSPDMKRLAGVPFMVTSQTTGEHHVIVTDENGYASTASAWNPHTANTNGNDAIWADSAWSGSDGGDSAKTQTLPAPTTGAPNAKPTAVGGEDPDGNDGAEDEQAEPGAAVNSEEGGAPGEPENDEANMAPEGGAADAEPGDATGEPQAGESVELSTMDDSGEDAPESGPVNEGETQGDLPTEEDPEDEEDKAPEALPFDPEAGIWFGMGDDAQTSIPADDSRGALPYDTYTITELPCPANEGLQLIEASVVISRDNHVVDLGTLDDPAASIATSAHDGTDGDSVLPCSETATIVDRVSYANLIAGREYTITGTLMDKGTGKALLDEAGNPHTASTTFTPDSSLGFIEMRFELPTTELQESTIVVFEEVLLEGRSVAVHADIEDQDQSVTVARPAVGTSASDADDGDAVIAKTPEARVVDRVSYSGVTPGIEHVVHGTLMDKAANAPLLIGDKPVEVTMAFTPEHASGTVEVAFAFDASALEDSTQLVVFEELLCNGKVIASHEDLQDTGQTVTVMPPSIQTSLQDAATGLKNTTASGSVRLADTVTYEGLVVGKEYEVVGTLMDKQSGEPALDTRGSAITARSTFVADKPAGSTVVTFEFDGGNLGSHTLVAYESLSSEGKELAVHADLSDEAQSVSVSSPQIHTQARAGDDAAKSVAAGPDVTIHDAVQISGAKANAEYTVVGVLMDKALGLPLVIDASKSAQGETATTNDAGASKVDGTAQLWSALLKAANVGYTMKDTGGCIELPQATDIDYQAVGKAIEAHAAEAERMALVAKTVKPEDSSFEVQMSFQIPTKGLSGQYVVFEALVENETGKLVAVHADLADVDQTVEITGKPTPEKGKTKEGSDTYDKTGNLLSRYAWVFALLAAAGCASAAYGIARRWHE